MNIGLPLERRPQRQRVPDRNRIADQQNPWQRGIIGNLSQRRVLSGPLLLCRFLPSRFHVRHGDAGRIGDVSGKPIGVGGCHLTPLHPHPVDQVDRLLALDERPLAEPTAEPTVGPFGRKARLGIPRAVDVNGRVPLRTENERHHVPGHVDHRLVGRIFGPLALDRISGRPGFTFAVGTQVIDQFLALPFGHFVVGPELEPGVLGVSVECHRAPDAPQSRTPLDQRSTTDGEDGQFPMFPAERFSLEVVPVDRRPMASQDRARLLGQHLTVQFVLPFMAVPRVALAAGEGAPREPVEQPLVVGVQPAGPLGQQSCPGRIKHVMERLVVEIPLGRIVLVRLVHVPHHRTIAMHHVGMPAGGISPGEPTADLLVSLTSGTNLGREVCRGVRLESRKDPVQLGMPILAVQQTRRGQLGRQTLSTSVGEDNLRSRDARDGQCHAGHQRSLLPIVFPGPNIQPNLDRRSRFQPMATDQCQPHHPARQAIHHALSRWSQITCRVFRTQGHTICRSRSTQTLGPLVIATR